MPSSLQRLSSCMSAILSILECPVCLETIPPPAHQCGNGHLICVKCRLQSERCPVCRLRFGRGRSLLADHVYSSLTDAFQLRGDPPELRSAKLKQRLIGKKKVLHKNVVQHNGQKNIVSPKNKFLTRIMGKSSSVENLTFHNVVPSSNLLASEFTPHLKTKSLSSSEIFNQGSPTLSRCSSVVSSNNTNSIFNSFRSYQGSTESLTQRMMNDFGETHDDGILYHCPCTLECQMLLKRFQVLQHIQECHSGPLVQYFRPNIKFQLPVQLPEDSNIILTFDSNTYFLKIINDDTGDYLIWMWILGSKFKAEIHRFVVTLRNGFPENPELSFKSGVLSLAATSWLDIVSDKRGILITKDILAANFRNLHSVELDISVIRKATPPTPV